MSRIMTGREVAEHITDECFELMSHLNNVVTPTLLTIRYGEDAAAISYEKSITKVANKLGVIHEKFIIKDEESFSEQDLLSLKYRSNFCHGILILKPMPDNIVDIIRGMNIMDEYNDVDCMFPKAKGAFYGEEFSINHMPCTAQAVLEIMDYYGIDTEGKHIAILGRSDTVGKPLAYALTAMNATVTLCHSKTSHVHTITSNADIIISAIGKANYIGYYHTNNGQVLIDVGINTDENGKLCGDIDTLEIRRYTDIEAYTPVPGGVGVVTNYILMRNTINSAIKLTSNGGKTV